MVKDAGERLAHSAQRKSLKGYDLLILVGSAALLDGGGTTAGPAST